MTPAKAKRGALLSIAAIAAVGIFLLYALVDPATHIFPRCIFKAITGWDCPGCGSQRAIHSLINGDIAMAWRYNALLVAAIPVVAILVAAQLMRHRYPRLYMTVNSRTAIWVALIILLAWGVVRNIWLR